MQAVGSGMDRHPSPNFGPRRLGQRPDMVVLHHTAMRSADAALARLCDPAAGVSAHYLIAENGKISQLVAEELRAWHAGAGAWGRIRDVNSHSIGIELANAGPLLRFPPFSEPQMAALESLLGSVLERWSIPPERVIAHSDMAPMRKSDPGAKFDWPRLARSGLSVWPETTGRANFIQAATAFGYVLPDGENAEAAILTAFRLRFRPGVAGPLDDIDRALIADLARRYPVDLGLGSA